VDAACIGHGVDRVGHGNHTGGVDGADLLDDAEKIVDFAQHALLFVRLELKPGQIGNAADVLVGQGHTCEVKVYGQGGRSVKGARQPEKTRVLWGMRYYLAFVSAPAGTTNNVVMRLLRIA
jgi:hypothetical protein